SLKAKLDHAKANLAHKLYHTLIPLCEKYLNLDPCPAIREAQKIVDFAMPSVDEDELSSVIAQENADLKAKLAVLTEVEQLRNRCAEQERVIAERKGKV